jgi:hypothetical protein
MATRLFTFVGGASGAWIVRSQVACIGESLPTVACIDVVPGTVPAPVVGWALRGISSNDRYVVRSEKVQLAAKQQALGRADATYAALIPIRKNAAWWAMTQDERRAVFEEQSQHMRVGMKYLPPIARRLHHCRDLSEAEAFDFLTWREWEYVEQEVDIRLVASRA